MLYYEELHRQQLDEYVESNKKKICFFSRRKRWDQHTFGKIFIRIKFFGFDKWNFGISILKYQVLMNKKQNKCINLTVVRKFLMLDLNLPNKEDHN
jgi:hypothetical protein